MSSTPTLREWLRAGPFSLVLSQGFFVFPALVGALLAIEECLQDDGAPPRPLRSAIHAVSGSSSGALVAAFVAAGHDLASLPGVVRGLDAREIVAVDFRGGGLVSGRATADALRRRLGAVAMRDCPTPVGVSAFDLASRRLVAIGGDQDLAAAVVASSCVPLLFAPQRLAGGRLVTDLAFFLDAGGARALPSAPESGRVLSVCCDDWNLRRLSRVDGAVTLSLRHIARVAPWAVATLGDRALREARLATRAACDRPLERRRGGELGVDARGPSSDRHLLFVLLLLVGLLCLKLS